jgi:hypothetical protein
VLYVIGWGEWFLGLFNDIMGKNVTLWPAMLEGKERRGKQRECWNELGRILAMEWLWYAELQCLFWWKVPWDGQCLLTGSRWPEVENMGQNRRKGKA